MEYIKYEIEKIDNDLCAKTRIIDSQNLKQIFDMFKNKPITF